MKTRFLTVLLSVVLVVGCLPLSSSATDIYHLEDDAQLLDVGISTVAPEPVYLQSLASISPYSTSTATYWSSQDIKDALAYMKNISSYTSKLGDTNTWLTALSNKLTNTNLDLSSIKNYLSGIYKFTGQGGISWYTTLQNGFSNTQNKIAETTAAVKEISTGAVKISLDELNTSVEAIKAQLGFPDGVSFYVGDGAAGSANSYYAVVGGEVKPLRWFSLMNTILMSVFSPANRNLLYENGSTAEFGSGFSLIDVNSWGFAGLASVLRGSSGNSMGGKLLNSSNLKGLPTDFWSRDLLTAFNIFVPMQNDLARLTYVLADPTTIELKESQQENEQALMDNFTGDKGVNSDDIGSMSGMGDSLGGFVDTGVTMDDGFTQLNNGDTWNFFSEEVANQLNTVPAVVSEDGDELSPYELNKQAFKELLEKVRGGK